jgi:hypothetical protein
MTEAFARELFTHVPKLTRKSVAGFDVRITSVVKVPDDLCQSSSSRLMGRVELSTLQNRNHQNGHHPWKGLKIATTIAI